ncbi:Disease resistance protein RPM1 [Hordeum vulgare]|nr:Disease resistance protein RPM1 [Hordeum vulgare]
MADLVVGLAKTVVQSLITNAQAAIDKDTRLKQSAHTNLMFITAEFEMMQSFLDTVAADEEHAKNKVVMTWVRQIRELASDLEDSIEFVVHLDMETVFWLRLLPSCVLTCLKYQHGRNMYPLDEAVDEIQNLRARVEDLSGRNKRYNIIADAGSQDLVQQQPAPLPASSRRQQGFRDLSRLISNEGCDLQVISVLGTGGDRGIATLIREAYNDPGVDFACRAWVKLMHPFNPHHFIRCFMAQFHANSSREQDEANIGVKVIKTMEAPQYDLLHAFVQTVNNCKCLIVLEDLPSMVEWDAIRTLLPDRKNGSRIIVSTQQDEIAGLCAGHPYQAVELKKFSHRHSAYAYFKQGSQGGKQESLPDMIPDAVRKWMVDYPLIGRESELSELCKWTSDIKYPQIMSVWGIAGVGKSTLVRHLYYKMLYEKKFDKFGWVDVCHPFKLTDLCRSLLLDMHEEVPINEFSQLLEQSRCLIVIDGVQSTKERDLISSVLLLSESSRSVVIVIANEANIATHSTDDKDPVSASQKKEKFHVSVFNVRGLESEAAHKLFIKEVSQKNQIPQSFSIQEREELEELILKCGGLPKVLVAISGLLTTKTATWMETASSINDRFMYILETNPEFYALQGIFDRMHATLRASPDAIKPFIFYLSIFPRDCNIRRRRLVRRWIAEGYSRDSNDKDAEENGEIFFSKLLEMGVIHQPSESLTTAFTETRMVSCQVDGFYREYIISRRMEENLVCELRAGNNIGTQRTGRHLIIRETWNRDSNVFKSMDFSRLRSMTVFGKWERFFISESMRQFRALDLENATHVSDEHLEVIFRLLPRLKFLSLRGCDQVFHLDSSSFCDLRELQTLDIRHTSIAYLPTRIANLLKLQYIRAGTTKQADEPQYVPRSLRRRPHVGVGVPTGIRRLIALRTLGVVNIDASRDILKGLQQLTRLRKLGVAGINKKNSRKFFTAISNHVRLESLSVRLDKDSQSCLDDIDLPLPNLHSLKLYGLDDKLPKWSNQLTKLTKLDLEMKTLRRDGSTFFAGRDDMMLLGELPKLCILRLRIKQTQDSELHFCTMIHTAESFSYQNVKILEISCSSKLHVVFGSKTMKQLELLKIDRSSVRFTGLEHLSELKEIFLKGSCDEELKQQLENQLATHPRKNLLKLHVEPTRN